MSSPYAIERPAAWLDVRTLASSRRARSELAGWPVASAAYTAEAMLGSGTFGLVLLARRHPSRWQACAPVAIKLTPRATNSVSRELAIMLQLRSAEAAEHGIIRLEEFFFAALNPREGTDGGGRSQLILCQVLPLYDSSLRNHIDSLSATLGPVGRIALARSVGRQLASALAYIHNLRIVHRDVKPENVLVRKLSGKVEVHCVLADFGAAKVMCDTDDRDGGSARDSVPYVCGIQYRAPELMFGSTTYKFGPDIWSFGCVVADTMIGSSARLFETQQSGGRTNSQLLTLLRSMGTPSEEELCAMNPRLKTHPQLYHWLRLPPMLPTDDWRDRLAGHVKSDAADGCSRTCSGQSANSNYIPTETPAVGQAHRDNSAVTGGGTNGSYSGSRPNWWEEHQLSELLGDAILFLSPIFQYDPNKRPAAKALSRAPFLFCP